MQVFTRFVVLFFFVHELNLVSSANRTRGTKRQLRSTQKVQQQSTFCPSGRGGELVYTLKPFQRFAEVSYMAYSTQTRKGKSVVWQVFYSILPWDILSANKWVFLNGLFLCLLPSFSTHCNIGWEAMASKIQSQPLTLKMEKSLILSSWMSHRRPKETGSRCLLVLAMIPKAPNHVYTLEIWGM